MHLQCFRKVLRTLDFLHNLLGYSLILNWLNLHTISHNDKAKIYILDFFYISIQTLYSVLCWSTFGSNYSLRSSWVWRNKHLYLGSFLHSSLQILSSSVRLDGERCCTAIFRSLQRCSIGLKSGLWLSHSRTFRDLFRSHSCVVLAVCLGSLSCWKVNLSPRSEVLGSLERVLIKDLSVLCSIHLYLDPD